MRRRRRFFYLHGIAVCGTLLFKVKRAFLKISNRFVPRGSVVPEKPPQEDTCSCCGAPAGECRGPGRPGGWLPGAGRTFPGNPGGPEAVDAGEIPPPGDREQEIRGWLLFLCINLTLIVPFSSIYEASSALGMYLPGASSLQFFIFRQSLAYHLGVIAATTFLAIFSFYAGLCLWQLKPNAVKTVKLFLISQLLLMMLLMTLRPVTVFTLGASPGSFADTLPRLIPFLLYFSVWYAYLSFSRRVHLTYQILPTPSPAGQPA